MNEPTEAAARLRTTIGQSNFKRDADRARRDGDLSRVAAWALPLLDPTPLTKRDEGGQEHELYWDEEWLRAVGFGEPTLNGYPFLIPCESGDPIELWLDFDGSIALLQSNRNDHIVITSRKFGTRGDLRMLCRSLGIELNERAG